MSPLPCAPASPGPSGSGNREGGTLDALPAAARTPAAAPPSPESCPVAAGAQAPEAPHATAGPSGVAAHPVTVSPGDWRFAASADESVLQAAARAGVRLPSSCRNGTCRACIGRLIQGKVHYAGARPGLSTDEMAQGWILPCIALPLAALHLHIPGAEALDTTPRGPIMVGPRR